MIDPESALLVSLVRVLRRLADEPFEQLRYLASLNVDGNIDELALEFDDFFRPAVGQLGDSPRERRLMLRLADLDDQLSNMSESGSSGIWTTEALELSPDWAKVRALATAALEEFGE